MADDIVLEQFRTEGTYFNNNISNVTHLKSSLKNWKNSGHEYSVCFDFLY